MAAILLIPPSLPSDSLSPDSPSSAYLPDSSDCMNLLLCENTPSPSVFLLLRFDPVVGKIWISSLPPRLNLTLNGISQPIEHFFKNGVEDTCLALSQTYQISLPHYLMLSRDRFVPLINQFSPTPFTLSEDFSMTVHQTPVLLKKGIQLLDGAQLLEWLKQEAPSSPVKQGNFLCDTLASCINHHLSLLCENRSQQLFSDIVNLCRTNLTFADYASRKKAADFIPRFTESPASALRLQFTQNRDATLSLSPDSLSEFQSAFCS